MTTTTTPRSPVTAPRVPAGVREGGQWTTTERSESDVQLTADPTRALRERHEQLAAAGYVPAVALAARQDPRTTAGIDAWWGDHFASAEYRAGDGGYPQMPDDYGTTGDGNALSGARRTRRMRYSGGGVELRMPAAAVVRRFAAETEHKTFDVPVTAEITEGESVRQVAGWVRIVPRPAGGFSVAPVGLSGDTGTRLAESVSAVLEARRPSLALRQVGDLLARRREREAGQGAALRPVDSSWVEAVGYDEANGIMAMATQAGGLYGHQVSRTRFEQVVSDASPGAQFNRIIKGNARAEVRRCEDGCGRFYSAAKAHTCPVTPSAPSTERIDQNAAARAAAAAVTAPPVAKAPAPAPGAHTPAGTVIARDVEEWQDRHLRRRESALGRFGPAGYTKAITPALSQFTTSTYVPSLYRSFRIGDQVTQLHNGDSDVMRFEGLHGKKAMEVGRALTARQRAMRHGGAPTTGAALLASARHPGKVEAFGYMVAPSREDERLSVGGVLLFDDAPDEQAAIAAAAEYGLDAVTEPARVQRVEVPWRPGEKAWRLAW